MACFWQYPTLSAAVPGVIKSIKSGTRERLADEELEERVQMATAEI
jgi:hypothetical protein